jgi:hypothetical protein
MTIYVGPTNWWWLSSPEAPEPCYYKAIARCCVVSSATRDGSRLICKANGVAWFVAPSCTQVGSTWAGGQYNSTQVGDKCCICEWSGLETRLISCGFNPCDWFVPSSTQLQNPGYVCRTNWDSISASFYWSSTEITATLACGVGYTNGSALGFSKALTCCVRAFRCVTY